MPITQNAKKAHRSSERKRVFNIRRKTTMKDVVKRIRMKATAGEHEAAAEMLPQAYKAIDKAAKRGVIKDNTAARKKSRLAAFLKRTKA